MEEDGDLREELPLAESDVRKQEEKPTRRAGSAAEEPGVGTPEWIAKQTKGWQNR